MSVFGNSELFKEFDNAGDESESDISDDEDTNKEYEEECKNLRLEIICYQLHEKLKKTLRILTQPRNLKIRDSATDGPFAHVILFNNLIARKFREEIQDFFQDLSIRKLGKDDYEEVCVPQPSYIQYRASNKQMSIKKSSRKTEAAVKAYQAFSSRQMYKKFFIDHLGEPLIYQDPSLSEWSFPDYDQQCPNPLDGDPDNPQAQRRKKLQRICFNCGKDDHQMKDCEKARDFRAVNQRRKKFMEDVAKYQEGAPQIRLGGPRYHKEEGGNDNEERFSSFKAGVISADLQEALGITENCIPPYIYQMRTLGYPPGHLLNARINNSGLSLYHEQEEKTENGEESTYVPVDVGKIISYPGFNIPPLPGQMDEFQENGVLPMDEGQSKIVMVSYFEHRNNIHRQQETEKEKQKTEEKPMNKNDMDVEEIDMEMGDEDEQFPDTVKNDQIIEIEDGEVSDDKEVDVGSLTEDELQIQREKLLKELEESDNNKNDSDYRNIKSNDQDYRIDPPQQVIDLTDTASDYENEQGNVASPAGTFQDVDNKHGVAETQIVLEDSPHEEDAVIEEAEMEPTNFNLSERIPSSDTDYRRAMLSGNSTHVEVDKHDIKQESKTEIDNELQENSEINYIEDEDTSCSSPMIASDDVDKDLGSSSQLPERKKFAKGITQFDAYYSESKSQGVYKKLRTLLKHSPRRQDK